MISKTLGPLSLSVEANGVAAGFVFASGCRCEPSDPGLSALCDAAIAAVAARAQGGVATDAASSTSSASSVSTALSGHEARVQSVRDLLRFGKYKPTGRGKPASEYLVKAAAEGRFPRINNLVDINNLVSLDTFLPISIVDIVRAGSTSYVLRRGRPGESYIFNSSGQVIDLEDLLLLAYCPGDVPCANPVKDSMATKLLESSTEMLVAIYAPTNLEEVLDHALERFMSLLSTFGHAKEVLGTKIVSSDAAP